MKDEIKEILDNFKIYEDRYKKCNETQFIIFYRDIHLLLDYITNLQEENERLKKSNENASKVCLAEHRYGVDKAEEARDYKSRNEKAIEYIEKYVSYYDMEGDLRDRLLEILNGEDKYE